MISATLLAQAAPHDGRGRREHFAHPRAAARPLAADDDHVARLDGAVEDALQRGFLALEDPRRAGEPQPFLAGDLGDRAGRREVAVEDDQVPFGLDRVLERAV